MRVPVTASLKSGLLLPNYQCVLTVGTWQQVCSGTDAMPEMGLQEDVIMHEPQGCEQELLPIPSDHMFLMTHAKHTAEVTQAPGIMPMPSAHADLVSDMSRPLHQQSCVV